jgi:hypothetical protein
MTSADKVKLGGIAASANNYVLPTATATVKGGVELFSDTVQSVAASAVTATASRTYGIQLNSAGQAVVNVPWTAASSSNPTTLGAIGSSAFMRDISTTTKNPGNTLAGSSLRYTGLAIFGGYNNTNTLAHSSTVVPAGTWRCMGHSPKSRSPGGQDYSGTDTGGVTTWIRIS